MAVVPSDELAVGDGVSLAVRVTSWAEVVGVRVGSGVALEEGAGVGLRVRGRVPLPLPGSVSERDIVAGAGSVAVREGRRAGVRERVSWGLTVAVGGAVREALAEGGRGRDRDAVRVRARLLVGWGIGVPEADSDCVGRCVTLREAVGVPQAVGEGVRLWEREGLCGRVRLRDAARDGVVEQEP